MVKLHTPQTSQISNKAATQSKAIKHGMPGPRSSEITSRETICRVQIYRWHMANLYMYITWRTAENIRKFPLPNSVRASTLAILLPNIMSFILSCMCKYMDAHMCVACVCLSAQAHVMVLVCMASLMCICGCVWICLCICVCVHMYVCMSFIQMFKLGMYIAWRT